MAVDPIPAGYRNVTPYLVVTGVDRLIPFLEQAFGGKETLRMDMPDGNVGHAEVQIGDSIVMMGEAGGQWPAMPAMLHLYVPDVDASYRTAIDAGATSIREPADQFYGDRTALVSDPSGNQWSIATHVEDVPAEEIARRAAQQGA